MCHWVPVEVRGQLSQFCPSAVNILGVEFRLWLGCRHLHLPGHYKGPVMFVRFISVMAYSLLGLVWLYNTLFIWLFVPLTIRWCKHTYTCLTAHLSLSQVCVDVDLLGHQSSQTVISKWITSVS